MCRQPPWSFANPALDQPYHDSSCGLDAWTLDQLRYDGCPAALPASGQACKYRTARLVAVCCRPLRLDVSARRFAHIVEVLKRRVESIGAGTQLQQPSAAHVEPAFAAPDGDGGGDSVRGPAAPCSSLRWLQVRRSKPMAALHQRQPPRLSVRSRRAHCDSSQSALKLSDGSRCGSAASAQDSQIGSVQRTRVIASGPRRDDHALKGCTASVPAVTLQPAGTGRSRRGPPPVGHRAEPHVVPRSTRHVREQPLEAFSDGARSEAVSLLFQLPLTVTHVRHEANAASDSDSTAALNRKPGRRSAIQAPAENDSMSDGTNSSVLPQHREELHKQELVSRQHFRNERTTEGSSSDGCAPAPRHSSSTAAGDKRSTVVRQERTLSRSDSSHTTEVAAPKDGPFSTVAAVRRRVGVSSGAAGGTRATSPRLGVSAAATSTLRNHTRSPISDSSTAEHQEGPVPAQRRTVVFAAWRASPSVSSSSVGVSYYQPVRRQEPRQSPAVPHTGRDSLHEVTSDSSAPSRQLSGEASDKPSAKRTCRQRPAPTQAKEGQRVTGVQKRLESSTSTSASCSVTAPRKSPLPPASAVNRHGARNFSRISRGTAEHCTGSSATRHAAGSGQRRRHRRRAGAVARSHSAKCGRHARKTPQSVLGAVPQRSEMPAVSSPPSPVCPAMPDFLQARSCVSYTLPACAFVNV